MKKRIFITNPDGSLFIMSLVAEGRLPGESDEKMFDRCAVQDPRLKDLAFFDFDEKEIPDATGNRNKLRIRQRDGKPEIFIDASVVSIKTPEQVKWEQIKVTASPAEILLAQQLGLEPKSATDTRISTEDNRKL